MDAAAEIARLRSAGYGWAKIARTLNARGVPTRSGSGLWHHSTVKRELDPAGHRLYMRRYMARWRADRA